MLKVLEILKQNGNYFIPKIENYERITEGNSSTTPQFKKETQKIPFYFKGNSKRANISLFATIHGKFQLPDNDYDIKEVPTFVHRNYTIIRNGEFHLDKIQVELNEKTKEKLKDYLEEKDGNLYLVLSKIQNTKEKVKYTKNEIAGNYINLTLMKAENNVRKKLIDIKNMSMEKKKGYLNEKYSDEIVNYLEQFGITNDGYAPQGTGTSKNETKKYDYTEFYIKTNKELKIPTLKEVLEKAKTDNDKIKDLKLTLEKLRSDNNTNEELLEIEKIEKKIKRLEKSNGKKEIELTLVEKTMYESYLLYKDLSVETLQSYIYSNKEAVNTLEKYFTDLAFNYITNRFELVESNEELWNNFNFEIVEKMVSEEVSL